jgi:diketogulonate reductase-like aldo/keto reductase
MRAARLNNGVSMPWLGLGSFQIPDDRLPRVVNTAVAAGYRTIDTASIYGNENAVGRAVADCGVARDELFLITKLWNSDQGYDSAMRAHDRSLAALGVDQVDLYLIHWPAPGLDRFVSSWQALGALMTQGRVRAIGVSNFQVEHLRRVIDETGVVPAVNQVELHPWLPQTELRAFHAAHGITTQAWSPLAQGNGLLADPVLTSISAKHRRTPAQVVLRWHLQHDVMVIPKSADPRRVRENAEVFDFELDELDLTAIEGLDIGKRLGPDPDTFDHG